MSQSAAANQPINLDTKRQSRGARSKAAPAAAPSGPMIKQRDVSDLQELRAEVKKLEARLLDAKKLAKDAELPILLALSTSGFIEPGPLAIAVEVEARRTPHWREEFEKLAGKDAALAIVERTTPTETKRLVISGG